MKGKGEEENKIGVEKEGKGEDKEERVKGGSKGETHEGQRREEGRVKRERKREWRERKRERGRGQDRCGRGERGQDRCGKGRGRVKREK